MPVWQALYDELRDRNFVVISIALDAAGAEAAGEWIRAAKPTYPVLIDAEHRVAALYDIVNVPFGVWIDEQGHIVRPPEPAGASDAFRTELDRTTFRITKEGMDDIRKRRRVYTDALRDWVKKGEESRHIFSPEEAARRFRGPSEEHVRARACFRLGEHLHRAGHRDAARRHFDEAVRLRPESWAMRRQAWALEDPARSGGPEFWKAVDALGDEPYYPPVDMEGMPR